MAGKPLSVDGHNVDELMLLLFQLKDEVNKPTMIFCKTTIGFGSPNKSGTSMPMVHLLGDEEIA